MDRSEAALQTARSNTRRHKLAERIDLFCGSWDMALAPEGAIFDLIVANPPYVRSRDIDSLQPEIRLHEPRLALDGSHDGLACIRRIIQSGFRYLRAGGLLALEMGHDQRTEIQTLAASTPRYESVRFIKDYSGIDRVVLLNTAA
jgi:release factor glutamine methyltransferase